MKVPNSEHGVAVRARGGLVTVVLGPTNTGKTHLAVERMLGHASGMIGLPLRLLAREIYDRVIAIKPPAQVALITGEEKILPPHARYFICTVEAMPPERDVAFLAVDEIQLCADPDRGHIFTDRLLNARGREETMFMGAATMRRTIAALLPDADIITRPRFSDLSHAPARKLSRLMRRTAVVAFSAGQVYALAEMLRRQRGGAAVVLGALSPRTRNAQVEMYQNGDVDYVVATDAIGMGLNMDIDHVAFAATTKFDGETMRPLHAAEVAQIAGRAGRHMNNGSFGMVAESDGQVGFDDALVEAVVHHRFDAVRTLLWRSADLDFTSPRGLIASLEAVPAHALFRHGRQASDMAALRALAAPGGAGAGLRHRDGVRQLWDACQIPDFRKVSATDHARLCANVLEFLLKGEGVIPEDWLDRQTKALERVDGPIDTLMQRIAYIRTWTYAANRPGWLADPAHWQERTRAIEDRLSDALHDRLRQRFVDRRTAVLMRELKRKEKLMAVVQDNGQVTVEGHFIGTLRGFVFVPDETAEGQDDRTLRHAADRALAEEIAARADRLAQAEDSAFALALDADNPTQGRITWDGEPVACLRAGDSPLRPQAVLLPAPLLTGDPSRRAEDRLSRWLGDHLKAKLAPLYRLQTALDDPDCITGLARGLAFQIVENLGTLPRDRVADDFRQVDKDGRRQMRSQGIWLGAASFYLPQILKPEAARLRLMLWAVHRGARNLPAPPVPGLITIPTGERTPATFYEMLGFRAIGGIAVRLDMLERVGQAAREKWAGGPFALDPDMMSLVGCSGDNFLKVMRALGYRYREPGTRERDAWTARQASAQTTQTTEASQESTPESTTTAPVQDVVPPQPEPVSTEPKAADPESTAEVTEPESVPEEKEPPLRLFFRELASRSQGRSQARRPMPRADHKPRPDHKSGRTQENRPAKADGEAPAGAAKPRREPRQKSARKDDDGRHKGPHKGPFKSGGHPRLAPEDSPFAALAELRKAMTKK